MGFVLLLCPFADLQMRKVRLRERSWFSQGQTANQESKTRIRSQAERLQNNHCTRLTLRRREKEPGLCGDKRVGEKNGKGERCYEESKEGKMPYTPGEKGERIRRDKYESLGEIEIGVFLG